ncbi:MAG: TlpA family protein disulfide reductase [Deltaproteobacteria bacterium]|nr:TlpA family protein disulfide reductase [Deltaproteobacteria bacterium]
MIRMALAALVLVLGIALTTPALAAPATDFTLRDINGESVQLDQYRGQVILLSFWATWCGPCKEEMPHLQALYEEQKDQGFVVLSVSSDDARTASRVKPYIRQKGYTFPVVLDRDSSVTGTYNPSKTLPYSILIGRDFEIAQIHSGYNPGDEVKIKAEVVELLAAPKPE